VGGTGYLNFFQAHFSEFLINKITQKIIFAQELPVLLGAEPASPPIFYHSKPEYEWVDFSTHNYFLINALFDKPVRRFLVVVIFLTGMSTFLSPALSPAFSFVSSFLDSSGIFFSINFFSFKAVFCLSFFSDNVNLTCEVLLRIT